MERYLLAISIGPVQGFISQARRTRDLWFGSELLSQLSQQVAESLRRHDANLIFPALEQLRPAGGRTPGVANKILATVAADDPRHLVEEARAATLQRLHGCWEELTRRPDVSSLLHPGAQAAAREQLDTFLEFFAAWAPWKDGTPYHPVRERVEQALAARKSLQAFGPWRHQDHGLHKSSLDGARESVLRRPEERSGETWSAYRIGPREELDAMGLIKRTWPQPGHFVPVPSIGLADWLEHARDQHEELLENVKRYCEQHEPRFTRIKRQARWVQALPYDAQVLLPDRWRPHFEDLGLAPQQDASRFGQQYVRPLLEAMRGEPFPFVACLVADGDHMGATLQALASHPQGVERQQGLSRALSAFSQRALSIVEEEHRGVLVYAGGDDVLAFVCPPDALACAQALREEFSRQVAAALEGTGVPAPTLSVGLGVGHIMESMGELLALGRQAEKLAKAPDRNALAVLFARRGGQERSWRCRWETGPRQRLDEALGHLESERVTLGKVHEVESLLGRLPAPKAIRPGESWAELLALEVERILSRTHAGTAARGPKPAELGLALSGGYEALREELRAWVDRLLVAEAFYRARRHRRSGRQGGRQ